MTHVLMPVFNEIDFDGRVERCASAVGRDCTVTVYTLDSGKPYRPQGFSVRRVRIRGPGPFRMLRPFVFWTGFVTYALKARPDVVHAHDYFMAFPGWIAARLTGARFIYDAHELLVPAPNEPRRVSVRIFQILEQLIIGRADVVIAASSARAEIMTRYYRLREKPTVVRNVPIEEPQSSEDDETVRPEIPPKSPGSFRLVYQGYLAERFHLDRYVRAVAALGPRFEMVMAGPGPAAESLQSLASRECPGRIFFLGRVPRRFLREVLRTADAGIVVYGNESLNELHCAPNKIFEYAQAGLPSIGNANPGLREIIDQAGIGVTGDDAHSNIAEIAARHAQFVANLRCFLARNTWQKEERSLLAVYERILPSFKTAV